MDDREVVAAIAAGDPAGIAVAYDKYAAGLYSYCRWMLHQQEAAGEAVRETFVVAATLGDLPEAPKLRPWLYAVARNECLRRLRTMPTVPDEQAKAADHAANPAEQPAEVSDSEQDEVQELARTVLAQLNLDEREALELSLRHDLYDSDLATALGVSWNQAYALTSRARGHLEKDLGTLLIARTRREDCPALGALLASWDGQATEQTLEVVGEHIEHCGFCAGHMRGALRQAVLSGLEQPAVPPAGLRDDVMKLCSPTTPETPMYRRSAEQVRAAGFSESIRTMRWDSIRRNPGPVIAAMAVLLWVTAAVTVALLTLTGSHPAQALAPTPTVSAPGTSPTAATTRATAPVATHTSAARRPSPTHSVTSAYLAPPVAQTTYPPSPKASKSPSPKASKSPSPNPSKSASPSPSPSRSSSASPSP